MEFYGRDFVARVDGIGRQASTDIRSESLAELLSGTDYRKYSRRMLEARDRNERVAPPSNPEKLLWLLAGSLSW
jgi:hypothetical protein